YLSESQSAAATFACRGDGSGTTVWPRSVFGGDGRSSAAAAAAAAPAAASGGAAASGRHKKFRYRLVAKCRILKGDGVREIEGWGDEASYFVVSDESVVRVESLLLFDESRPLEQRAAKSSTLDRARPSSGNNRGGGGAQGGVGKRRVAGGGGGSRKGEGGSDEAG
ncbi:unnamed protein product, partial [Hapterophycus canaliculatus]